MGARAIPPQEVQTDLISNLFEKPHVIHRRDFSVPSSWCLVAIQISRLIFNAERALSQGAQREKEHDDSHFFSLRVSTFIAGYSHCPVLGSRFFETRTPRI